MGSARRMWSIDTYVNAKKPTTNYHGAPRLGLRKWDSPDAQYAYLTFPRPFPFGAQIVSAKLTVTTYSIDQWGDHTLNLSLVSEKTSYSRMTWNNRPDVRADNQITLTKNGKLDGGTTWEFDVKAMLQLVSDGKLEWNGFRVTTGDTQQRWLYAQETTLSSEGPWLQIEWSDRPDEPQNLTPNEGVVGTPKPALSFEYIDVAGDISLAQAQIQTSPSASFSTISWDSGILKDVTRPVIYLSGTTYPGATPNQRVYYRIKVADGAGLWSRRWSAPAWFTYKAPPVLTMTSLDESNPRFGDSTPDISWTLSGGTQTAYRVTLARTANPSVILWDTGKVGSSDNVISVPPKVMRWDDTNYRLIVRVWDDEPRVSAANSLAYSTVNLNVHLDQDDAMEPVSSVRVEQVIAKGGLMPFANVIWDRPISADAYEIARQDGDDDDAPKRIVGRATYEESLQGDGTHRFQDRTAPGNTRIRYIVRPVTNGHRAPGRPSAWTSLRTEAVWITTEDPQGGAELMSLVINGSDQGTWELPEEATVHQVRNSQTPTIIRELHRGYQGSVDGIVVQEDKYQPYLTLHQKKERFFWFKKRLGVVRLIAGDVNIPVRLANMNLHPTPDYIQQYAISFDFYQDGEAWWDVEMP